MRRAARVDVRAQDELLAPVGAKRRLDIGAIDEVAGVRQAGGGDLGRFRQDREVGRDHECRTTSRIADVLRRRRAALDSDTAQCDSVELERLLVQQPDPVLAGALRELSSSRRSWSPRRRQRRSIRRCQTREHVLKIARVRELDDVAEQQDQVDLGLGEPRERRFGALVQALGLEDGLIQREPAGSSSQWRSLRTPSPRGIRLV